MADSSSLGDSHLHQLGAGTCIELDVLCTLRYSVILTNQLESETESASVGKPSHAKHFPEMVFRLNMS